MTFLNRRTLVSSAIATTATALIAPGSFMSAEEKETPVPRKNRIHQSVSRWCYEKIPLDQLCVAAAAMGLKGIDLLEPDEFEIPRRYGLICTMGYVDAGTIGKALNRVENHDAIEAGLRKNVPLAAKAGVPNVITFSGLRAGLSDEEGARNTVIGLRRVRSIVEDHGINLCMELLNSKKDHHDYMCDHTAWGVRVLEEVNSPNIKLLYDIYHMQIMEGDLIATIRANSKWLGHFHTGGVPGRHELNDTQEVNWRGVMSGIADTGYTGYVAHEFVPTGDPLTSLRQAVDLCDVG
ncbi:hydroxypyruvate isomerase family protein [Acidicapsa ligni]|uniref:hydroxypyruvate isomerase family protein n=1 Tax=Acidicapsa ligni TaxID=542300 RepID=UPI0021E0CBE2|nr:TIM barrel protein [Acidicapsa ligni]